MEDSKSKHDSKLPKRTTCSSSDHWLYGKTLDSFDFSVLPRKIDVIRNYYFMKNFLLNLRDRRQLHDDDLELIKMALVRDLCDIWTTSNVPFVEQFRVKVRISELIEEAQSLERSRVSLYKNNYIWIEKTLATYEILFDLSKCRCYRYCKSAEEIIASKCTCSLESGKKIPNIKQSEKDFTDLEFYSDQKFARILRIATSIDTQTSWEITRLTNVYESRKRRRETSEKNLEIAKMKKDSLNDDINLTD